MGRYQMGQIFLMPTLYVIIHIYNVFHIIFTGLHQWNSILPPDQLIFGVQLLWFHEPWCCKYSNGSSFQCSSWGLCFRQRSFLCWVSIFSVIPPMWNQSRVLLNVLQTCWKIQTDISMRNNIAREMSASKLIGFGITVLLCGGVWRLFSQIDKFCFEMEDRYIKMADCY